MSEMNEEVQGKAPSTYNLDELTKVYIKIRDARDDLESAHKKRIAELVNKSDRPVQFIFSGKAHPKDHGGKELIARVVQQARKSEFRRRVVFLGDSITAQWRLNQYFPSEDFLNRAINLQLSAQLLAHMKPDVIDVKANAVVLGAGTYDINREVPLALIKNNFELLADIAEANNIKVLVPSVLPVNDYLKDQNPTYERTPTRPAARIKELNDWLKTFCAQHKFTYVDYYAALVDPQGMLQAEASDDGLHPNSRGYRLMAPILSKAIDQTLKPAPPPPAPPAKPSKKK